MFSEIKTKRLVIYIKGERGKKEKRERGRERERERKRERERETER